MTTPPAGYAEATIILQRVGAARQSTWTCGFDDANFNSRTPLDMAIDWYTQLAGATGKPYYPANMPTSWIFQGVQITKMLEDGPLTAQFLGPITGTITDTAMPPNVAVLVTKDTAAGGRRNRGRFFVPPVYPMEGSVDSGGVIGSTQLTSLRNWYTGTYNGLVSEDMVPCLFHSKAPFTPTPVTSWTVQPLVATQRRRLRK